jgi:molecular chaperone IbpA
LTAENFATRHAAASTERTSCPIQGDAASTGSAIALVKLQTRRTPSPTVEGLAPKKFLRRLLKHAAQFQNFTVADRCMTGSATQREARGTASCPRARTGCSREDMVMRNALDFTPYRRSLIGFDSMFDLMEHDSRVEQLDPFPPYDIEQHGEDAYHIRIVVAGYTADEIEVTAHNDFLIISGRKEAEADDRKIIYRGIAAIGRFERRFQLAPYVVIAGANLADGILDIELRREVPDAAKPRKIELGRKSARRQAKPAAAATEPSAPGRENRAA